MRTKTTVACSLAAFVAIAGGTAEATGLIQTANIAKGAVTLNRLAPNVQKMISDKSKPGINGINGVNGANGVDGLPGAKGATGAQGANGIQGPQGPAGAKGDKGDHGDQGEPG